MHRRRANERDDFETGWWRWFLWLIPRNCQIPCPDWKTSMRRH